MTKHNISPRQNLYLFLAIFLCALVPIGIKIAQKISSTLYNSSTCKRCNIVLIVIDPLRADALPCYGYFVNTAPNICKFAENNILFTNVYSQSSWTLPSIMSLFSSQYPTSHNVFIPNVDVLPAQYTTLPMTLKAAGYTTTFIGPVNEETNHVPLDRGLGRGFDNVIPYTTLSAASSILQKKLSTSSTAKPAFIFIHSFDLRNDSVKQAPTLFPLDPTYTYGQVDPYLQKITLRSPEKKWNITSYRRIYDERLRQLDEQFQSITDAISDTNQHNKTVISITSNHGDEFGEHGQSSHGVNLYKSVTHVPLILSVPNQKPQLSHSLVQSIDIYPTLLDVVGVRIPSSVRGIPVLPQPFSRNQKQNTFAISQLEPEKNLAAIRTRTWAYYFNPEEQTKLFGTLYNTVIDPTETQPVASPDPAIIHELISAYEHISSK